METMGFGSIHFQRPQALAVLLAILRVDHEQGHGAVKISVGISNREIQMVLMACGSRLRIDHYSKPDGTLFPSSFGTLRWSCRSRKLKCNLHY